MELGRECLDIWGYRFVQELLWVKTNQLQRIIRTGRTGTCHRIKTLLCTVSYIRALTWLRPPHAHFRSLDHLTPWNPTLTPAHRPAP